jgi:hypothetical protein
MTIESKTVMVTKVPTEDLEFLRPIAARDRRSDQSDAAVMRYALVELVKLKRREREAAA